MATVQNKTLVTNTNELTSIADAIRAKGNINSSLLYPTEFISAINNINTSGGNYTPFPGSTPNARIRITQIDLSGQAAIIGADTYPEVDLTQLLGRNISISSEQERLMAAILNLKIGKSDGNTYDISTFFNEWRPPAYSISQQNSPWLIGGFFTYFRSQSGIYSVSLNGAQNNTSITTDYDFPQVRINQKDNNGHTYIHFLHPFNDINNNPYSGTNGTYTIVDLYNIFLIERQNYPSPS